MPAIVVDFNYTVSSVTDMTVTSETEAEVSRYYSDIELNFLIVGALFAAVLVLAFFNVLIHFAEKRQKAMREGSMAALGDRSRFPRSMGGGGGGGGGGSRGRARAMLLF